MKTAPVFGPDAPGRVVHYVTMQELRAQSSQPLRDTLSGVMSTQSSLGWMLEREVDDDDVMDVEYALSSTQEMREAGLLQPAAVEAVPPATPPVVQQRLPMSQFFNTLDTPFTPDGAVYDYAEQRWQVIRTLGEQDLPAGSIYVPSGAAVPACLQAPTQPTARSPAFGMGEQGDAVEAVAPAPTPASAAATAAAAVMMPAAAPPYVLAMSVAYEPYEAKDQLVATQPVAPTVADVIDLTSQSEEEEEEEEPEVQEVEVIEVPSNPVPASTTTTATPQPQAVSVPAFYDAFTSCLRNMHVLFERGRPDAYSMQWEQLAAVVHAVHDSVGAFAARADARRVEDGMDVSSDNEEPSGF